MRLIDSGNAFTIWVSANDTYDWAHKPGAAWPCSSLSGKRFCATFNTNGLLALTVNGRYNGFHYNGDRTIDSHEFNACVADFAETRIPKDHPCYFVVIGQFK